MYHFASVQGKLVTTVIAGRFQLVTTVIHRKLLYSFAIYRWPVFLLKKLDQSIKKILWTGSCDKRKQVVPSLEDMCRPTNEGGLNLRSLRALNRAALVKTV